MTLGALRRLVPKPVRGALAGKIVVAVHYGWPSVASWLRQRWAQLRNPLADISFGKGCRLGPGFCLDAPWGGTFRAGDGCEFRRGFRADLMGPESVLEIGTNSSFTYYAAVQCGTTIRIGRRVTFAQGALVVDGSHRFRDLSTPAIEQGYDFRPIEVGDDVMVMAKATVIASVRERAFIGANAVVTREIPAHTVAVGVPARVIDYFGPPGGEPEGWPDLSSGSGRGDDAPVQ